MPRGGGRLHDARRTPTSRSARRPRRGSASAVVRRDVARTSCRAGRGASRPRRGSSRHPAPTIAFISRGADHAFRRTAGRRPSCRRSRAAPAAPGLRGVDARDLRLRQRAERPGCLHVRVVGGLRRDRVLVVVGEQAGEAELLAAVDRRPRVLVDAVDPRVAVRARLGERAVGALDELRHALVVRLQLALGVDLALRRGQPQLGDPDFFFVSLYFFITRGSDASARPRRRAWPCTGAARRCRTSRGSCRAGRAR